MGTPSPFKLTAYRHAVLARLDKQPNITIKAVRHDLAPEGIVVGYDQSIASSSASASHAKKALRASALGRPDVQAQRGEWLSQRQELNPRRLVFIDEIWTKPT